MPNRMILTGVCLLGLCFPIHGRELRRDNVTAFVDVSVLPMDRNIVLPHQTVVVAGGLIAEIGPAATTQVPQGAQIISGAGRWLLPGLADMHTHIDSPAEFPLLFAYGVTTTLNMGGASDTYVHEIRTSIRAGEAIGPEPLIALKIDGPGDPGGTSVVPTTKGQAIAAVRRASREYDYVKVYSRLSPAMFDVILDECRRLKVPVIGHVVRSVGLERSLTRGQVMLAHVEEYLTVFGDDPPDEARIPQLVKLSVAHHVTVTANIGGLAKIAEQWGHPEKLADYLGAPAAQAMRETIRGKWRSASYARLSGSYTAEARFGEKLTAALHAAGVPILVGTDAPDIPGVPPGQSVFDEIVALTRIGFSNYDALACATSVPGTFVHNTVPRAGRFGVIAPGYRADVVLLEHSPLETVENLLDPLGVMVRGHWLPRETLRKALKH